MPSALLILTAAATITLTGPATVVDGDTLRVGGERVRLAGIDAPEMRQICAIDLHPMKCGVIARDTLQTIAGTRIVVCVGRSRDRYRRVIATCHVEDRSRDDVARRSNQHHSALTENGQVDLSAAMVASGWALAYRHYSLRYVSEENIARRLRRGMWAGRFEAPWEWRREGRAHQDR